eukprot:TRINITY_DN6681_c0_g1_i3.p1 TRINITY_DN6681_c0_g1~~TRINITY_DN6681_c0_g1_i3.p1  ORF type:complete len:1154 (+),score=171.25 TRINITY_DN6681_c0_g1_i3:86-3547(+)
MRRRRPRAAWRLGAACAVACCCLSGPVRCLVCRGAAFDVNFSNGTVARAGTPCAASGRTYSAGAIGGRGMWLFACGVDGVWACDNPDSGQCLRITGIPAAGWNACDDVQDLAVQRSSGGGWYLYLACEDRLVRCEWHDPTVSAVGCARVSNAVCPNAAGLWVTERGVAISPTSGALLMSCWTQGLDTTNTAGVYVCELDPGGANSVQSCNRSRDPCGELGSGSRNQALSFLPSGGVALGCWSLPNAPLHCANYSDATGVSDCTLQESPCSARTVGVVPLPSGETGYACYADWKICSANPTAAPSTAPSAALSPTPSQPPSSTPSVPPPTVAPTGSPTALPTRKPVPPAGPSVPPAPATTGLPSASGPPTAPPDLLVPPLPPPSSRPIAGASPSASPSVAPRGTTSAPAAQAGRPEHPPPAPPPPLPPPPPPELEPSAVERITKQSAGATRSIIVVATFAGQGAAMGTLSMALDSQCDPSGTFAELPPSLHPTGIKLGNAYWGVIVGAILLVAGAAMVCTAALALLRRSVGDTNGLLSAEEVQASCLRYVPGLKKQDAVDIAAVIRVPSHVLLVALLVYQGATFAAMRIAVRGEGVGTALRVLAGAVLALLAAFPVVVYFKVKSGVSTLARPGPLAGLGKVALARVRPWDDPAPPRWMQYCLLSERGDWVSRRRQDHWVNRWQAAVRQYDGQKAAHGFAVELGAMWLLSIANVPRTPTQVSCGHVRVAVAAVHALTLLYCACTRPYRCIRDNVLNAVRLALTCVALLAMAASFYSDGTGHAAAAAALNLAWGSVLMGVVSHVAAEVLLFYRGWRGTAQQLEWGESTQEDELCLVAPVLGERPGAPAPRDLTIASDFHAAPDATMSVLSPMPLDRRPSELSISAYSAVTSELALMATSTSDQKAQQQPPSGAEDDSPARTSGGSGLRARFVPSGVAAPFTPDDSAWDPSAAAEGSGSHPLLRSAGAVSVVPARDSPGERMRKMSGVSATMPQNIQPDELLCGLLSSGLAGSDGKLRPPRRRRAAGTIASANNDRSPAGSGGSGPMAVGNAVSNASLPAPRVDSNVSLGPSRRGTAYRLKRPGGLAASRAHSPSRSPTLSGTARAFDATSSGMLGPGSGAGVLGSSRGAPQDSLSAGCRTLSNCSSGGASAAPPEL